MEFNTWDVENIEEKLKEEEKQIQDKNILKYEDNYYIENKSYVAFPAVSNFLAAGLDYSEKGLSKCDSIDALKEKMKNDYDVSLLSSLDQRLNHVTSQHPNPHVFFPKFVDLVPKKSKRCKSCKKFIVQADDSSRKPGQKLELCHLFLNQFPYCYIFKIDPEQKVILLKFVIFDFKETKISFKEVDNSPFKVNIIYNIRLSYLMTYTRFQKA